MASMAVSEAQRKMKVDSGNGDGKSRQKMVEEDNGLWTVECLRGRLLAERVASKAAKRDEELMGRKLIELEEKLKLEIKLKNKAEKTLKFLLEKLESLKLSPRDSPTASLCIPTLGEETTKMGKCNSEAEMSESRCSLTSEDLRNINLETADVISPGSRAPSVSSSTGDEDTNSKRSDKIEDSVKGDLSLKSNNKADNTGTSVPTGARLTFQSRRRNADNSCNDAIAALGDDNQLGNSMVKGNAINPRATLCHASV